ncbi:filamentous hemagglutinin N-terminal domain-containing protein [Campylobacter lari]|uniref:Filamentous hemagglutinin N-terminal domain-containing protein n=1 Tax=Campylobacter lari TaxID=201 RepID=A0A7U8AQ44_CAMLA|nr:filamentous hemagglutinin N-terminal domain-containing protein [Campylobacter lari]
MKKLANHIILSSTTVSMLFSPLMALPSGGKFTHGTSGTISKPNNNTLNINGHGSNSVIQWGGGFNIGKGESVNFGGNSKNYLNIAHGTSKSTIEGLLNANGKNVFLINPNGVIITKTGTINANRFVASTSSMSNDDMWKFAKFTQDQAINFSPLFKPNGGNVVNMGNINANSLLLQGKKVFLDTDTNWDKEHNGVKFGIIKAKNITLEGKDVYVDVSSIDGKTLNSLNIKGENNNNFKGSMFLNASGYYYNPNSFLVFDKYKNSNSNFKVYKYVGIGSDVDWWLFAKGWNENKDSIFRNIASEYRLTNDIDFKANCKNGVCNGQNYANYWVDLNGDGKRQDDEFTNMIVGGTDINAFTRTFNGQGFTLKNININTVSSEVKDKPKHVGLFGSVKGATFKNINVDYMDGEIRVKNSENVGGFVGFVNSSKFENIYLNNIKNIDNSGNYRWLMFNYSTGGFAGTIDDGIFSNISLNGIESISSNYSVDNSGLSNSTGGFAGSISGNKGSYSNIFLNNIGNISDSAKSSYGISYSEVGGFVGIIGNWRQENFLFSNIFLNNIGNISNISSGGNGRGSYANSGGFAGRSTDALGTTTYSNISLNGIKNIISNVYGGSSDSNSGGFIGAINGSDNIFSNISLKGIKNIISNNDGGKGYLGGFTGFFSNIVQSRFENIYIYFNSNIKFNNNSYYGKFFIVGNNNNPRYTLDNIHIYHHENDLSNATYYDQFLWNDFNKNNYIPDKINIHTYNDNTQENVYNDFLSKANTIKKPNITPPSPTPIDPIDPKDPNVKLNGNDLHQDIINDEIIADITNGKYELHISDLLKMLDEKGNYSKMSEKQKVEFAAKYFLYGDKTKALEVVQSLDFLLAYKNNGLSTASKDKFEGNGFNTKEDILKRINNTTRNIKDKINKLEKELEPLANSSDKYLKDLIVIQNKLDEVIKAYNKYVNLINKGLASKNDPEFIVLKNQINTLMKDSQVLAGSISENQEKLSIWQNDNNTENFKIVGAFANTILNTNPKLEKITGEGGDGEDPNKPDLPESDMEFEQTASLNLIGDEALDEEKEQEGVDETSLLQKSKTCIVSYNYKTMNPCAVRH